MTETTRNLLFWMAAALVIFLFWSVSSRIEKNERQLSFSDFMAPLERGHVAKVTITGTRGGGDVPPSAVPGRSSNVIAMRRSAAAKPVESAPSDIAEATTSAAVNPVVREIRPRAARGRLFGMGPNLST